MTYIGNFQDNSILGLYDNPPAKAQVHLVRGLLYPDGPYLYDLAPAITVGRPKKSRVQEEKKPE